MMRKLMVAVKGMVIDVKEHKEDIIKIISSSVLLIIMMICTHIFDIPLFGKIVMFAVPYLIAGFEVLKQAAENIIHGEVFDENFLMSIATLGAFAVGEYPEAVFVMIFFGIGELFEHIAYDRSRKSISDLMDIRSDSANLKIANEIKTVRPEEVKKGDIIIVKPGEKVPLDGIIFEGSSALNTTALTGESLPVDVKTGDKVISGCVNINGLISVSVTNEYTESTAVKILKLIENSAKNKAKTEGFITRFSRVYTPIVVALSILVAVIPSMITGEVTTWIYRALMCLVVSCPCALVVSVPLSYFSGIGGASQKGILIKGANSLENLADVRTLVFDKTGTLTHGSFFVTAVHPETITPEELLETAALAESYSDHPISRSLKQAYGNQIDSSRIGEVREISGFGVEAKVDGKCIYAGNDRLMRKMNITFRDCHRVGTIVHIAVDGEYAGHIVISDKTKPDSINAINELKKVSVHTVMFTGDREEVAKQVADETGVDEYCASLLPQDKVSKLETLMYERSRDGKIAFVGDGINDAPVLARADIGIAMGALGSDAAIEAADMVLMDDKISKIPVAMRISGKTNRIVKENIIFALLVKVGILVLSAMGLTNMWFASFADVGVLVIAVLNAVRAMKIK